VAGKKISNGLVALSSAAVLAVYAAGYQRTAPAAARFAAQDQRRLPVPIESSFVAPAEALPSPESRVETQPADIPKPAPRVAQPAPAPEQAPAEAIPAPEETTVDSAPSGQLPPEQPVPAQAPAVPAAPAPQVQYKDGTFFAWGTCRHGDLRVAVTVQSGRITSAEIAECETRYPCTWIEKAPGQVVERQTINVDNVSGATESIKAFQDAVFFALSKAK
jgi:uncharacterized protein with FMN-binding domain